MIQTTNLYIEIFGLILFLILLVSFQSFRNLFTFSTQVAAKKGERSQVVDFVRGVAMCAIVAIHIDSYFAFFHPKDTEIVLSKWIANISRFCVPAFIFSSGFFLSWKGFSLFWTSKVKNLLVPYIIVACIGYFTKYPLENFLSDIIPKLLLGKVFQPYYYVPLLFGFYLLYSLFFRNIQNWNSKLFYVVLIASFVINIWSNHFYPKSIPYLNDIEAISVTNYIFFFVAGFSAKRILTNKEIFLESFVANKNYLSGLIAAIALYLTVVSYYTITVQLEISNHFLFYPIACFIFLTLIGIQFESTNNQSMKKLYSAFVYIGENSLALFLLHPMTIHLMHMIDPYYLGGFYLSWIITFAINICLPLITWKLAYGIIGKLVDSEKKC